MITIRDVARRARVAPMTVSRVLNNPDTVRPGTRLRVETAIAELNYIPNRIGQGLRSKRTMSLGLIVSDITNPFAVQQITGVSSAAREHGYTVAFAHTDSDADEELRQLQSMIERRVDGIILSPVLARRETVDFVHAARNHLVVLGYAMNDVDVDVVRCDTRVAAEESTRYLLELGHRRIDMISGPQSIVTATERADGYVDAMRAAGLTPRVTYGRYTVESGFEMALGALSDADDAPTAFITANNFIAMGAAQAARHLGRTVPDDVSIATFDNARTDMVLDPFFTGVVQPVHTMARIATEMLVDRMQRGFSGRGRDVVVETSFEVHASTAPPRDARRRPHLVGARAVLPLGPNPRHDEVKGM